MTTGRSRGQHAGLTAATIVRAAIDLADREGLERLSMRRLGAELGVEAMAVYHHVPNKDALLDGMVEHLATAQPPPAFGAADWQDGLRDYARTRLETLLEHPRLVSLVLSRPAVTQGNLRLMEALLKSLIAAGFRPGPALDIVYGLNALIVVHAALAAGVGDAPAPHGERGQTERLSDVEADEFPLLSEAARISAERGDPRARFEFSLDALVTGFAARRPASASSR